MGSGHPARISGVLTAERRESAINGRSSHRWPTAACGSDSGRSDNAPQTAGSDLNRSTDHLRRAAVSSSTIPDAQDHVIYPLARTDAEGQMLSGENDYAMRFEPGALLRVDGFWPLTIYRTKTTAMAPSSVYRCRQGASGLTGHRFALQTSRLLPHREPMGGLNGRRAPS